MNVSSQQFPAGSAANYALASCPVCHKLSPVSQGYCDRCGKRLTIRTPESLQTTLALVLTAALCYIPANIFPIMSTTLLGKTDPSTIIGGVLIFLEHESYFIAFVIFTASVVIPLAKMLAIVWICHAVKSAKTLNYHDLTRLYRMTELVGKWSMIDVFVVAILVALIQAGGLVSVQPGIAANAFAAVVILTMIAAKKFDVRLIWDKLVP